MFAFSKKDGSSNGAGSAANYKHLATEKSSLSELESEDELQIDETPPPRRKSAGPNKKKKLSGKKWVLNKNDTKKHSLVDLKPL